MVRLTRVPGGFRLDRPLDPYAQEDLRQRSLPRPQWEAAARTWGYGDDEASVAAVRYLAETHATDADEPTLTALANLEFAQHAPTHAERVASLEARLRPYQREGVAYALQKKRILLADSMGLGKSLQALVAVETAQAFPCIVVCPSAVKSGWQREVVKWMPWRSVQVLQKGREAVRGADFTVLNPELLPAHLEKLKENAAKALVLDEAHFFKNPDSQRSRNALDLSRSVPLRLALTGTPIKNRREDLVHQLRILDQLEPLLAIFRGVLPHWYKPEKGPLPEAHAIRAVQMLDATTLNARLREVCMVRRTKHEVAPELPPLTRTRVEVTAGPSKAYQQKEEAMLEWVRKWQAKFGAQAAAMEPAMTLEFRAHLTKLRREAALAKMPFVREWVEPLVESGERVIFFAYHKDVVERLRQALPGKVAVITGDTPPATRRAILDALDHVDFLVATMDSTGYGVDGIQLHASHVAFVELDWTPTKHEQCEGRLHRIGQTEPVNSWYFVASQTIDRAMMGVLEGKWGDIQGVVDGRGDGDDSEFLAQMLKKVIQQAATGHRPQSPEGASSQTS